MSRARKLTIGSASLAAALTYAVTGGFGRLSSTVTQAQTVTTDAIDVVITPNAPVSTSASFTDFTPGTFHEVLYSVGLQGTDRASLTFTLQASVTADTTLSTAQPGDATNSIDADVDYVAVATPSTIVSNADAHSPRFEVLPGFAADEGGVVAEVYACASPNVWDYDYTLVGGEKRDYYCDDTANNLRGASWSNGTLLSGANSLDVEPTVSAPITLTTDLRQGRAQTFLVRYLFVSDGPTGTRQNVQSGEQLQFVNTFRVDPATGVV
jgi:hypothetical protein